MDLLVHTHTHNLSRAQTVLLDKFTQCQANEEDIVDRELAQSNWALEHYHSLDPLLRSLVCIDTRSQFERTILNLFKILTDRGPLLSFGQMHVGLKYLPFEPRIYFTIDDWDSITDNGRWTDDDNLISAENFVDSLDKLHQQYLRKRFLLHPLLRKQTLTTGKLR